MKIQESELKFLIVIHEKHHKVYLLMNIIQDQQPKTSDNWTKVNERLNNMLKIKKNQINIGLNQIRKTGADE